MFEKLELDDTIEIQSKAYKLLRWVSEGIQKGFIHFERAHQWTTASSAASAWLREHFGNVPPDCRPVRAEGPEFDRFVNYFASYLLSSFDIDPNPGLGLRSHCGCYCPICTYFAAGTHLRPKKVFSVDKKRAETLKRQYLEQLAIDNGLEVSDSQLGGIMANDDLSRAAALCAYLSEVFRRCSDLPSGPESLALWRQFAWNLTGSPIKGFKLRTKDVLSAQAALSDALKERATA